MKENPIKDNSFAFALRIVNLYKHLIDVKKEFVPSIQVLRSGTSIGALVRESEHAENKADFYYKLNISQKEANETEYWIQLLFEGDFIEEKAYMYVSEDLQELKKLIASIIILTKKNLNKK